MNIKFNLIARVAEDKNFFVDLIYAVYQAKIIHNNHIELTFIGSIESEVLYITLTKLITILELQDQINFTKVSIRYDDMSDNTKSGYFINYSSGLAIGYSGIECLNHGLKTIFYNIDKLHIEKTKRYISFCEDYKELINLFNNIRENKCLFDKSLLQENQNLIEEFRLNSFEADLLKALLFGKNEENIR